MKRIILSIMSLLSLTAVAQKPMTLRECIDYALNRNVQVKQSALQRQQEEVNLSTAKNARLPEVSGGANQSFSFGRGLTAQNTYVSRNTASTGVSVSAFLPLFTGFRLPNQKKQAELNLQAATADLEKVREDLSVQIAQAYLQALYQKEMINVAKEQLSLSRIQYERIQRVYDAQKASGLEVNEAKNTVAQDELALVQNENNYKLALLDLSQLIEMSTPDSLDVIAPAMMQPQPVGGNPEAIFEEAVMSKPAIRAQKLRIESAQKSIDIARAGYWPTLSLNGGIGTSYYHVNGGTNPAFGHQFKDNFNKSIGISLNIPIFDHFQTRNNIRMAKINYEGQRVQFDQVQKELYKEIQTAWYNAVAAQKKYEASRSAEEVAHESFVMMTKKFEYGKANATEYNEQKTKYANAQTNRINAQYEYVFRNIILDFYKGTPIQ